MDGGKGAYWRSPLGGLVEWFELMLIVYIVLVGSFVRFNLEKYRFEQLSLKR